MSPSKQPAPLLAMVAGAATCGVARLAADGSVVLRRLVPRTQLERALKELSAQPPETVIVGSGATSKEVLTLARRVFGADKVRAVDDTGALEEAVDLHESDHPRIGLRRLLPRWLSGPRVPLEDYAAVVVARRWRSRPR